MLVGAVEVHRLDFDDAEPINVGLPPAQDQFEDGHVERELRARVGPRDAQFAAELLIEVDEHCLACSHGLYRNI